MTPAINVSAAVPVTAQLMPERILAAACRASRTRIAETLGKASVAARSTAFSR